LESELSRTFYFLFWTDLISGLNFLLSPKNKNFFSSTKKKFFSFPEVSLEAGYATNERKKGGEEKEKKRKIFGREKTFFF
jgi:hypothetical protein